MASLSQANTRAHNQIYEQWYDWLRYTRRKDLASAADVGRAGRGGNQGVMFEITPFPNNDGKQESWAEFTRLFKELMNESGQREVLDMANLTGKLQQRQKYNSRTSQTRGRHGKNLMSNTGIGNWQ